MRRVNSVAIFLLYLSSSALIVGCSNTPVQPSTMSPANGVSQSLEGSFQIEEENFASQLQAADKELALYLAEPGRDRIDNLISAHDKYQQLEAFIRKSEGESSIELVPVLKKTALVNSYFYFYPKFSWFSKKSRSTLGREFSLDPSDEVISSQELSVLAINSVLPNRAVPFVEFSYKKGKKALDSIVNIFRDSGDLESEGYVKATVAVADWEFVFGRASEAKKLYRHARGLVENLEDKDLVDNLKDEIFDTPKLLVDPNLFGFTVLDLNANRLLFEKASTSKPSPPNEHVTISFDIRRIGTARNLKTLDSQLKDKGDLRLKDVRTFIRTELLFRPQYSKSGAIDTQKLKYQISLTN